MCDICNLRRRDIFKTALGVAAATSLLRPAATLAQGAASSEITRSEAANVREFIVRGGHVLTMNATLGDLAVGDVHVRDGAIVAVGANINAPNAKVIDAREMIVMPGFVETHWHLWSTALRGVIRGDDPKFGYFPTTLRVGPHCTAKDAYISVRLGVVEGLLSGITTVHNWSHNTRTPEYADAEIQALKDTGVRARFSYGWGQDLPLTSTMNLTDLARVQRQWGQSGAMLGIGAALRSPTPGARGAVPVDVLKQEVEGIRKLGLPMTMHAGAKGLVDVLAGIGALGPDMLLVHPQGMSEQERKQVADTKSPYSTAPVIEMSYSAVRSGYIQYDELKQLGVPMGLSIDSSGASASADFFNIMRALMWSDWQRSGAPSRLKPQRLVELATIEGARLLGLGDVTGSLEPGKRADIILVRKMDVNMVPVMDPYYSLVFSGQPSNVDTVIVDGRIVSMGGKTTSIDLDKVVREAVTSALEIRGRMI
jgi:5-methylthioadenosine/S-adenosylhomocysteine deaminase